MASIVSAASCGMFGQLLGMSKIYEYVTRSELLQVSLQFTVNKLCGKESSYMVNYSATRRGKQTLEEMHS